MLRELTANLTVLALVLPTQPVCASDGGAPTSSASNSTKVDGYGNTKWGMGIEQVKKVVKGLKASPRLPGETSDESSYDVNAKVAGHEALSTYRFFKGGLSEVVIAFRDAEKPGVFYPEQWTEIEDGLTSKYGEPEPLKVMRWVGKAFATEETPQQLAQAIARGDLELDTLRVLGQTAIEHKGTSGGDMTTLHILSYRSKDEMKRRYDLTTRAKQPNTEGL